jgi:hypothetical protein
MIPSRAHQPAAPTSRKSQPVRARHRRTQSRVSTALGSSRKNLGPSRSPAAFCAALQSARADSIFLRPAPDRPTRSIKCPGRDCPGPAPYAAAQPSMIEDRGLRGARVPEHVIDGENGVVPCRAPQARFVSQISGDAISAMLSADVSCGDTRDPRIFPETRQFALSASGRPCNHRRHLEIRLPPCCR